MSTQTSAAIAKWAIVRIDRFQRGEPPTKQISVVKVLTNRLLATREVERLRSLREGDSDIDYYAIRIDGPTNVALDRPLFAVVTLENIRPGCDLAEGDIRVISVVDDLAAAERILSASGHPSSRVVMRPTRWAKVH